MKDYKKQIKRLKRQIKRHKYDSERWTKNGLYNIAAQARKDIEEDTRKIEQLTSLMKESQNTITNPKYSIFGKLISFFTHSKESFYLFHLWINLLFIISNGINIVLTIIDGNTFSIVYLPISFVVMLFINYQFVTRYKRVLYTADFPVKFLKNDFVELMQAKDRYYKNIAVADSDLKDNLKIDEKAFNRYVWTLAQDIYALQTFFEKNDGEALSENQVLVFQPTINQLKAEITKVQEIVKNLVSISIVNTKDKIGTKYITPSTGDSLAAISRIKLESTLELTSGKSSAKNNTAL